MAKELGYFQSRIKAVLSGKSEESFIQSEVKKSLDESDYVFCCVQADEIQKSTSHKYIRRVPKSSGKGYNYFYPKDFKKPFKALLTLFGMKEDTIDKAYTNNNISQAYGVTKESFAQHVLEYLTNRKAWNTFFSNKANREMYKVPQKNVSVKATTKVSDGGSKVSEKVTVKETENYKTGWNRSLMRKIYSMYNKVPEDNTGVKPGIDGIFVGDKVSFNGEVGTVTKDFNNGFMFVNFDSGAMGRFAVKDLQKLDVTNDEVTESAEINGDVQEENKDTSALSQAMMGNQNAKKNGIPEGWGIISGDDTEEDLSGGYKFDESRLIGVSDPKKRAETRFKDALYYLSDSFNFNADDATDLLMALANPDFKQGEEVPDFVRDKVLKFLWGKAMLTKNQALKDFYNQIKDGETPKLLSNLYESFHIANEQTVKNPFGNGSNTIGNIKLEAKDYEYLMDKVAGAYEKFQAYNDFKDGTLKWSDDMFNFIMADDLKKNPDWLMRFAELAAKYKINNITGFLNEAKKEFDNTFKDNMDNSVIDSGNFERDLFDEKGKQIPLDYKDIQIGLSDDEKKQIMEEVRRISDENGFGISGDDLERYANMWQNGIRQKNIHDQNMILYKVYSILEDSNWHTENDMLMQGKVADVLKEAITQKREERIWKQRNGILERINENETVGEEYFNNLINHAENDEEIEAINEAKKKYYDDLEMKDYRTKSDRWEKYEKKYEEARKKLQENDKIQNLEQAQDALNEELKDWDVTDENLHEKVVAVDNFDAAKKAKIDYLQEKIKGFNNTMAYGNTFPASVVGNLPRDVTLIKILTESKGQTPQEYVEKLYQAQTGYPYWDNARRRDNREQEKWDNVKEIVRLQNFKDKGLGVEDGKVVTNVKDINGMNVKEGDIIRVSNSYAESDNGLWKVQKLNDRDSGNGFWLHKVKKDGTESNGKYTTNSWPMNHTYSSNPSYRAAYRDHNGENGENVKIELFTVDETLREKNAAKTPKYQFTSNGIRTPSGKYTSVFYGINDDGSVNVSSRDYGGTLRFLATETDKVQNDTDTMTDYFDKDSITVSASNPYYKQIKRAALKDAISGKKKAIENAKADIEKYTGKEKNYYYADQYLKRAKEVLAEQPKIVQKYESELKTLEKELKGTVKKSLPAFIIKDGRFLIRK